MYPQFLTLLQMVTMPLNYHTKSSRLLQNLYISLHSPFDKIITSAIFIDYWLRFFITNPILSEFTHLTVHYLFLPIIFLIPLNIHKPIKIIATTVIAPFIYPPIIETSIGIESYVCPNSSPKFAGSLG